MRWIALPLVASALLAGCGDSGSGDDGVPLRPPIDVAPATTHERTKGPIVGICDRRLRAAASAALRAQGFRGRLGEQPLASGTSSLSVCEMKGARAEVSVSLDAASDAVRRYRNRVTETAQFSGGDPENAPHTVKGVGDPRLGGAGANWLPRTNLLLSARGDRVLIVDVSAEPLAKDALLDAAIEISLAAWDRLGGRAYTS